jgi:phage terminase small subunit
MSTSDERAEGAYLPQAAKVEMPEVRQRSDAAAELMKVGREVGLKLSSTATG